MFALFRTPSFIRYLSLIAILSLGVIALLGLAEQLMIENILQQTPTDAALINVAGKQRMFSQRISKDALAIQVAQLESDTSLSYLARRELHTTLDEWQQGHNSLFNGDPTLGTPGKNSPTILQLYKLLEPHYLTILHNATNLLATVDSSPSPSKSFIAASTHNIYYEAPTYLMYMNDVVTQYQQESQARTDQLQRTQQLWFVVLLVALILEGVFIYRPTIIKINGILCESEESKEHTAVLFEEQFQLNQLKDQMLLNVNHELRTLMTSIYGYLELLHDHFDSLDEHTKEIFFTQAIRGCEEFQVHVNIVLNALKVGNNAQPLNLEALSVSQLVHSVLDLFDPNKKSGYIIEQKIAEELLILADRQSMYQVLRNILANAFKYVPQDTTLTISATTVESTETPSIRIMIKDRGHGIPANEVALLFNKFVRLRRDLASTVNGTGLGLYISKQLVEAMHGRIWVESYGIEGEGSCFFIELPMAMQSVSIQKSTPSIIEEVKV